MDWDKLRVFHAVAEAGSFTHAGDVLNLSQSAVSRQISGLEESLNVSLFHRHARGLLLTEQGELLFGEAHEVFNRLSLVEQRINDTKQSPEGPLKITTTVAFGSVWLTPRMAEFLKLYPGIEVSLVLSDVDLDLSMREADVAIRMTPPTQGDLIQRHLMNMPFKNFANPDYLKRHGIPKNTSDLDQHKLIVYGEDAKPPIEKVNWLLEVGLKKNQKPRPATLRVNSIYGIFRAVEGGLGIGALPDYMQRESSRLVEVLPEMKGQHIDAYFVYPEELKNMKRIAVFRDYLIRRIAEDGYMHNKS
ncbi:MAG: LysR family transcriptional regulator [Rhodospirillaceae bacterium]|nr:LysR family transcriptional regulator [Rhodospirillaceae bacterium]MBL6941341.1 LysR family transcriptional regulator [Rhodospirillales bacterium]